MTVAAAQASAFYEQVAREGKVFTLLDGGNLMVFPHLDGEVVPFWSSRARAEGVCQRHPKFGSCTIDEITLEHFLDRTLAQLATERVRVGVNWSGARLTGYDLPVEDLRRNLGHRLERLAAQGTPGR